MRVHASLHGEIFSIPFYALIIRAEATRRGWKFSGVFIILSLRMRKHITIKFVTKKLRKPIFFDNNLSIIETYLLFFF